jgi:CDP-glycerol glycerophosphotransferase (TagB/SpsB family)
MFLRVFYWPIYFLAGFFPRDKSIWVFGSYGNKFNDNSKYLFLFTHENYKSVKTVWISGDRNLISYLRNKGLNAHYRWSLTGIFYALRARVYFYSSYVTDINGLTGRNSIKINLWHGIPIKKIEFDITKGKLSEIFKNNFFSKIFYFQHYIKPNFIISPSISVSKFFKTSFGIEEKSFVISGFPRNSILFWYKDKVLEFIKKYEKKEVYEIIIKIRKYSKTFIYLPTWRDDNTNFIKKSGIDFSRLNDVLKRKNNILLIKFHVNTFISTEKENFENIIFLNNVIDIYPILPFTDCLITDYSSIYFDYKLLNKEIILFPFDKEEYLNNREFYYDYDFVAENQVVAYNFNDLVNLISLDKIPVKENKFVTELIGKYEDHMNSCKQIIEFVESKL